METVQMKLRKGTVKKVSDLCELLGIENRTEVVANAIKLAHYLVSKSNEGAVISIEHNGENEAVVFTNGTE